MFGKLDAYRTPCLRQLKYYWKLLHQTRFGLNLQKTTYRNADVSLGGVTFWLQNSVNKGSLNGCYFMQSCRCAIMHYTQDNGG
jgi:hypothetical protein